MYRLTLGDHYGIVNGYRRSTGGFAGSRGAGLVVACMAVEAENRDRYPPFLAAYIKLGCVHVTTSIDMEPQSGPQHTGLALRFPRLPGSTAGVEPAAPERSQLTAAGRGGSI
jgi:hypothetical protein